MAATGAFFSKRSMWRAIDMIFVTVGNANQGFKRLLEAVDEMAGLGIFKSEEIIVQSDSNNGA